MLSGISASVTAGVIEVLAGAEIASEHGPAGVYGLVTAQEARRLVDLLRESDDPGSGAPDVPWAGLVPRANGSVAIACSPMQSCGVFYAQAPAHLPGQWLMATDPGLLIRSSSWRWELARDWLGDFVAQCADPTASPYVGMRRLLPGQTLLINAVGETSVHTWCGPDAWPEPDLQGPAAGHAYLDTFDAAVGTLAQRGGPITAEVSGGLDSTFVVASLARQHTDSQPILGLVAQPLADAVSLQPSWVFNDAPFARMMEQWYPQTVKVESVTNTAATQFLDVAADLTRAAWWPTYATANLVWMQQISERAQQRESLVVFSGQGGNGAFSWPHNYAAGYYARRHQWGKLIKLGLPKDASATERLRLLRSRVLAPLLAEPPSPGESPFSLRHPRSRERNASTDRDVYLLWLAGHQHPFAGFANPGMPLLPRVDPFRSRAVLDCAARITPGQWHASGLSRGFARTLGIDRVPDAIRLRTARGTQGADAWLWTHNQRERFLAECDELAATAALAGALDVDGVRAAVMSWAWNDAAHPPPALQFVVVSRILALAQFCRATDERLARLPLRH